MSTDAHQISLDILYEDNHMIAVVKPSGVLSQADGTDAPDMLSLLSDDIARRYGKPGKAFVGLVHRLDRNVGGTMVFAKTSKGASRLSEDMRMGRFFKGYFALTHKRLPSKDGFLRNKLEKDERRNKVFESSSGKMSVLYFREVYAGDGNFVYFVLPITGRTHQIRAQFAFAGSPLVGDNKYGNSAKTEGHSNDDFAVALWSAVISVYHPVRREEEIVVKSVPCGRVWKDADISGEMTEALTNFENNLNVAEYRKFYEVK